MNKRMFFDKRNARNFALLVNSIAVKEPRESVYRFSVVIPSQGLAYTQFKTTVPNVNEYEFNLWLTNIRNKHKLN